MLPLHLNCLKHILLYLHSQYTAEVILNNHFDNDCNCGTSSEETFNNNIIKNKKLNLDMKN